MRHRDVVLSDRNPRHAALSRFWTGDTGARATTHMLPHLLQEIRHRHIVRNFV